MVLVPGRLLPLLVLTLTVLQTAAVLLLTLVDHVLVSQVHLGHQQFLLGGRVRVPLVHHRVLLTVEAIAAAVPSHVYCVGGSLLLIPAVKSLVVNLSLGIH